MQTMSTPQPQSEQPDDKAWRDNRLGTAMRISADYDHLPLSRSNPGIDDAADALVRFTASPILESNYWNCADSGDESGGESEWLWEGLDDGGEDGDPLGLELPGDVLSLGHTHVCERDLPLCDTRHVLEHWTRLGIERVMQQLCSHEVWALDAPERSRSPQTQQTQEGLDVTGWLDDIRPEILRQSLQEMTMALQELARTDASALGVLFGSRDRVLALFQIMGWLSSARAVLLLDWLCDAYPRMPVILLGMAREEASHASRQLSRMSRDNATPESMKGVLRKVQPWRLMIERLRYLRVKTSEAQIFSSLRTQNLIQALTAVQE